MNREEFIRKFMEALSIEIDAKIMYLGKGTVAEDEKTLTLIRETNLKYFKTECDELLGDFVVLATKAEYPQIARFECSYLFSVFEEGGWDAIWEIINYNLNHIRKMEKNSILELMDENDYSALKDKLFIRPLNYPDHRHELKNALYRRIGDIVLVLYILIEAVHAGGKHNVMSAKVHRKHIEEWGISDEEIFENALMNTYLMTPPRLYISPMELFDPPYEKGAFMALGGGGIMSLDPLCVPVLTTTGQMNGAISLFYPGVQERIAELYGDDYYVAFTSIHEVRLHKKNTIPPLQILRRVKEMNAAFDPAEILTRKLYVYERTAGRLRQMEL